MAAAIVGHMSKRCFGHFSMVHRSVFGPHTFADPITDIAELKKPIPEDDLRNYRYLKPMNTDQVPVFYRDHVIDKLIRVCMKEGKKDLSRRNVYAALELVKRIQYKKWLNKKEDEYVELDPFVIANKAIRNCTPLMKLLPYVRGGVTYQVPFPIRPSEAEFKAMKMMRNICRERSFHGATHFPNIMASELVAAFENEGLTVQAKQDLHKQCEANRAFAHYRSK
ncbi:unnamed protein product [Bursaphelenchus xylophilus]|uniref:Small ribosomal subunit protein uS7m n=1 Tax=Bursaphelenchus xylophilus TaxID=6326 RepID=A0A1I7S510_BURXY|nr:unnamed protein product [Bursaphelenchus xylophilus]CAG9117586.1 unnamed protein product [Bursaphelenchus xylophilus]